MAQLELAFLGTPQVCHAGKTLTFPTRKALALLTFLATEGGLHTREQLTDLLWPASDEEHGRATLRSTLAFLRRSLRAEDGEDHLIVDRSVLCLDFRSEVTLDLHALQAAYRLDGDSANVGSDSIPRLREAAGIYRGDFLTGLTLDDAPDWDAWVVMQRETWHARANAIYSRLTQLQLDTGLLADGLAATERWLVLAPLHEEPYIRLMQIHLARGDRSSALQMYARCERVLSEELGVTPSIDARMLAERARSTSTIRRGGTADQTASTLAELPLIGRVPQMKALIAAWSAAEAGAARVLRLEGEGGAGKTRLAAEFSRWVDAHGSDVLAGRAFQAGGHLPYGPLLAALRPRLEKERAPDDLLGDVWLAELSRVLPEIRERYPDLPDSQSQDAAARARLFETIARLVIAWAQISPLVLFLDDLQWADADTLEALQYIARRLAESGSPVLLLLAARSEDLSTSPTLAAYFAQLSRELPMKSITVGPLTSDDVLQLLQDIASPDTGSEQLGSAGEWLFTQSDGNAFHLLETVRSLLERGVWQLSHEGLVDFSSGPPTGEVSNTLPPGVRQLILSRLLPLSPHAFGVLAATAVLGQEATFDDLAYVAGLPESEALTALDETVRTHLLDESGSAGYLFSHDRIRQVVYEQAGEARRRIFHRRALERGQMTSGPPALLAHHALAGLLTGPAFRFSLAAGDQAMAVFAVRDAIGHYQQAHALYTEASLSELRDLYLNLGRAHELASDFPSARDVYAEMLQRARDAANAPMEAAALNRLATLMGQETPLSPEIDVLLQQAIRLAGESGDRANLAETEWNLAQTRFWAGDVLSAVAHGERALQLAQSLDRPQLTADCLNVLAHVEIQAGKFDEVLQHASASRALYASLGNRAMEADSLRLHAHGLVRLGFPNEGIALAREAYDICLRIENVWGQFGSLMMLTLGLLDTSLIEEALDVAQRTVELALEHGSPPYHILAFIGLGNAQRACGLLTYARESHLRAVSIAEHLDLSPLIEAAAAELCADYVLLHDWPAAFASEAKALAHRDYVVSIYMGSIPRQYETEAFVRAGEADRAREDLRHFAAQFEGRRRYRIPLLRGLAVLALHEQRVADAVAHLREALILADAIGMPAESVQIRSQLAALQA